MRSIDSGARPTAIAARASVWQSFVNSWRPTVAPSFWRPRPLAGWRSSFALPRLRLRLLAPERHAASDGFVELDDADVDPCDVPVVLSQPTDNANGEVLAYSFRHPDRDADLDA